MKKRELFIILAMICVVAFFFVRSKRPRHAVDEAESEVTQENFVSKNESKPGVSSTVSVSGTPEAALSPPPPAQTVVSENVMKQFAAQVASMQKCLGLAGAGNAGVAVNPTPDALIGILRPSLGETVVQIDDWSQTDFVDKSGVKKRMRVDFDYPDGVTPSRRLSMYTVNSYGALEIDNLTNDQTDNPNAAYIDSLKEGTQVMTEERAARVYFSQGEELVFTLKNGRLDTVSISKGDRAMNCSNLSDDNSKCSCP